MDEFSRCPNEEGQRYVAVVLLLVSCYSQIDSLFKLIDSNKVPCVFIFEHLN